MVQTPNNPIEDSLLVACNDFLHIVALTGNNEGEKTLQNRFSALINIWKPRFEKSDDPSFPDLTEYIPFEQWAETTAVFRNQVIQFVGDLAEYLLNKREAGY